MHRNYQERITRDDQSYQEFLERDEQLARSAERRYKALEAAWNTEEPVEDQPAPKAPQTAHYGHQYSLWEEIA